MTTLVLLAASLVAAGPVAPEATPDPEPQVLADRDSIRICLKIRLPKYRIEDRERWRESFRQELRERIRESVRLNRDLKRELRESLRERFRRPVVIRRYRGPEPI
jgi:hypothetical protein